MILSRMTAVLASAMISYGIGFEERAPRASRRRASPTFAGEILRGEVEPRLLPSASSKPLSKRRRRRLRGRAKGRA